MMMPNFVKEYASSIPELAGQVAGRPDADVLRLVQPDQYSFGAAAWYYSQHCDAATKAGVKSGSTAGWSQYVTGCLGTTVDEARKGYWLKAMAALYVPVDGKLQS